MIINKQFTILIFCTVLLHSLSAQVNSFKFDHINIEDGLSSNTISSVIQDRKGFLWIGTEEGLCRYDGYSFKTYKHKIGDRHSLAQNYIWDLHEDKDGIIWIATDGGGLNKFDPVTETFLHFKNIPDDSSSISSDNIQSVYVDKNNIVWVGTWEGGLNKFNRDQNNFVRYLNDPSDPKSIGNNKVFTIFEDSKNNLWIGTDGGGASILNRETGEFTHFTHRANDPNSISSNNIVCITEDSNGNLWFGTYGAGLCKFDPVKNKFVNYKTSEDVNTISGNQIWDVFEDSRGILWIGTLSNGLNIYNPETDNFIRHKKNPADPSSISSDYIRKMLEDKSGVLWIGTIAGGLNKIDRKPEKFFHLKHEPENINSLSKNFIYSIYEDSHGDIWFGTYQKELNRYNPVQNKFTHYSSNPNDPNSLHGLMVRTIYEDSFGDLWIGTYFGSLQKFNRSTNSFIRVDLSNLIRENESVVNIRTIFEDKDSILWLGTNGGGLLQYERLNNKFIRYSNETSSGLSNDHILSICEDSDGFLWIGTYGGGLNRFNKSDETFVHYTHNSDDRTSISDNVITKLYSDNKNNLWIGTYFGGLNKFDLSAGQAGKNSGTFTHFTEEQGLASNLISDIIEDDSGILWVSTIRGITKFNPSSGYIKNYDKSSGALGEYNPGAGFKTKNGWIYFGSIDGVTYFHPDNIHDNNFVPTIVLSSFKKLNQEVIFEKNIAYVDTIMLSHNDIYFSFEFASLDYTIPERNQFAYMLEGFDQDWIYSGNRNLATYTNIGPGQYIFKVKGTNNDGIWNNTGASVVLIIKPPFWATWWFLTGSILIFLSIGPIIYYKRVKALKREKHQQEEFSKRLIQSQEEERKRIASELHDSLGQNLLIIKNRAALGLKSEQPGFEREQLGEISAGASSAIDEIRRISYNLHPYQLDRLGLTKAVKSILNQVKDLGKIHFTDSIENIDNLFSKENEINIYRIVQECVNNIIKHSEADYADVRVQLRNNLLNILVNDNGKGLQTKKIVSKNEGFGMKNISERIKILNGNLMVESLPGKGTTITIKIPVS